MLLRKVAPIMVGFSMALWTNTALNSNKSARTKITSTQKNLSLFSFQSEYKMKWHRVEMDYSQFSLVGRHNSKVVGGYETRAGHNVFGIPIGANRIDVNRIYGLPLRAIHYQSTSYLLDYNDCDGNTTHGTYLIDGHYVTFYYDLHKNNIVRSIIWINAKTEFSKHGYYGKPSDELRIGLEDLMVELINHERIIEGLQPLIYDKRCNFIARQHSSNMITHQFFSHEDHNGNHSNDRLNAGRVHHYWYGENIAQGQPNSIFAHEALMNSKGHRINILRKEFTHIFVGVCFKDNGAPYYTVNFYSK
ncbi:CAP domain-containing protein [Lysinibacillus xylanilyticus]|uniref:CAP domain-containing protein n=1 Tax=Lysinibacillus xylanilyticus TaxID=582475 RepID=UPI002B25181E|nr:CAP-associated domain-containing protein [Lysinibacillus xylanilyticus]MEB2281612.1 CAP domain-containing protein [Lysinibacillus xylanilyticus]